VTTSTPPRRLPAARRRDQLLSVALDLFGTGGYHTTSMEDIAEAAGVTKPVLYQHFPSKSVLYLELIETVGAGLLAAVSTAATAESAPYHRVRAGFQAYFRFVGTRTTAFRLLFGGSAREGDEFAHAVADVERSIAGTIASLIDVDLDGAHRDLLAYGIVGLAEVTSRQWVLRTDRADAEAGLAPQDGVRPRHLDPAEGDVLAVRLADLVWAGLRGLPPVTPSSVAPPDVPGPDVVLADVLGPDVVLADVPGPDVASPDAASPDAATTGPGR
jgi:AcrR family transcriptional regulator